MTDRSHANGSTVSPLMTHDYCCKIGRVTDKYSVLGRPTAEDSIDETLLARWQGRNGYQEQGYRTLTEWFNRRLFEVAGERAGRRVSDRQLDAEFDVLTGGDELEKLELRDELTDAGLDAEALLDDMVSWSTMRIHLNDCLEAEKTREATTDWERNSIEIARSQATEKISEAVGSLGSKGRVAGGDDTTVSIEVQLHCDQCDTAVPLVVALERGYVCSTHHRD